MFGNDATVAYAASQGILELNTYLPVMADALLESGALLANVCGVRREVRRRDRGRRRAGPRLRRTFVGAGHRAEPDHRLRPSGRDRPPGQDEDRSIIDVVIEDGVLDADEAGVLDPARLANPPLVRWSLGSFVPPLPVPSERQTAGDRRGGTAWCRDRAGRRAGRWRRTERRRRPTRAHDLSGRSR